MAREPVAPPEPDDIVLEDKKLSRLINHKADAKAARLQTRSETVKPLAGVTSVRRAVREDAENLRDKLGEGVGRTRDAIRDEPMRTTLYAVGVGLILGLLLRS